MALRAFQICEHCLTRFPTHGDPRRFCSRACAGQNSQRSLAERFWEKVRIGDTADCWPWLGATNGVGYGKIWDRTLGRSDLAHRVAYHLAIGPVPDGREIDHLCRNRACVNPAHLEAVTPRENQRRALPFRPSRTGATYTKRSS